MMAFSKQIVPVNPAFPKSKGLLCEKDIYIEKYIN
jgi:hypothetical protein